MADVTLSNTKKPWQSKTIWAAAIYGLFAIVRLFNDDIGSEAIAWFNAHGAMFDSAWAVIIMIFRWPADTAISVKQ